MTDAGAAEALAQSGCGSVVAAAGCGKTELIVQTVASLRGEHQLVLTHTNAGVNALRQRFARRQIAPKAWTVDTIDGWCRRFVKAYPASAGVVPETADGGIDWEALRLGMLALLERPFIKRIVRVSYAGVLVDEYQDCNSQQHALVCSLAKVVPTRVLGDPMQAIFGFGGNQLVPWGTAEQRFPRVLELRTPHRWRQRGANAGLGQWLSSVRGRLQQGQDVDLRGTPVRWLRPNIVMTPKGKRADFLTPAVRAGCGLAAEADEGERIVILSKWDPQCQKMAMRTGGLFQCVEPIEARDGQIALRAFAASSGSDLIAAVLSFAGDCCTGVKKHTNKFGNWSQGRGRPGAEETRLAALLRRLHEDANGSIADVLANLRSYPEVREYRRELLHTVISSLRDFDARLTGSTLEAFMQRRQAASRIGRSLARRSVGTPLLLKGLEFEHAVVVVDGQFSAKELYVALTRGTRSVTVVSAEPRVVPKTG